MNRSLRFFILAALLLAVEVQPALGAPATASFMLKDPYIAGREAGRLFFGARCAMAYLEMQPDGSRSAVPDVDGVIGRSDNGTYVMLAAWALPIAYALFVPDAGKDLWSGTESSVLRGLVAFAGGMTWANWQAGQTFVVPYFQRKAAEVNRARLGQQDQPAGR